MSACSGRSCMSIAACTAALQQLKDLRYSYFISNHSFILNNKAMFLKSTAWRHVSLLSLLCWYCNAFLQRVNRRSYQCRVGGWCDIHASARHQIEPRSSPRAQICLNVTCWIHHCSLGPTGLYKIAQKTWILFFFFGNFRLSFTLFLGVCCSTIGITAALCFLKLIGWQPLGLGKKWTEQKGLRWELGQMQIWLSACCLIKFYMWRVQK